jgi:uncharacterized protein
VNTSPLILLSKVGLLEVLRAGALPVLVPDEVLAEIARYGSGDPTLQILRSTPWLQVVQAPPRPPLLDSDRLGAGELSVLAVALSMPHSEVVLDDLSARRSAQSLGLPIRGTISFVLQAKHQGIIPAVRPVFDQLRALGMYLSDRLIEQVSSMAGE